MLGWHACGEVWARTEQKAWVPTGWERAANPPQLPLGARRALNRTLTKLLAAAGCCQHPHTPLPVLAPGAQSAGLLSKCLGGDGGAGASRRGLPEERPSRDCCAGSKPSPAASSSHRLTPAGPMPPVAMGRAHGGVLQLPGGSEHPGEDETKQQNPTKPSPAQGTGSRGNAAAMPSGMRMRGGPQEQPQLFAGNFLNEETLAEVGESPQLPSRQIQPLGAVLEARRGHLQSSKVFSFPLCHRLNRSPRASSLRRSVWQPDASQAGMLRRGSTQPPPAPQLIIRSRGRADRSQRWLPAGVPGPVLLSSQSSPRLWHRTQAPGKPSALPPASPRPTLPKPTSPNPCRAPLPPSHAPGERTPSFLPSHPVFCSAVWCHRVHKMATGGSTLSRTGSKGGAGREDGGCFPLQSTVTRGKEKDVAT